MRSNYKCRRSRIPKARKEHDPILHREPEAGAGMSLTVQEPTSRASLSNTTLGTPKQGRHYSVHDEADDRATLGGTIIVRDVAEQSARCLVQVE